MVRCDTGLVASWMQGTGFWGFAFITGDIMAGWRSGCNCGDGDWVTSTLVSVAGLCDSGGSTGDIKIGKN